MKNIYVVVDTATDEPILKAFESKDAAEIYIETLCDKYIEDMIQNDDPMDVIGEPDWSNQKILNDLFEDAKSTFSIMETILVEL